MSRYSLYCDYMREVRRKKRGRMQKLKVASKVFKYLITITINYKIIIIIIKGIKASCGN